MQDEPVNLLTDEECERIAELSTVQALNLKGCNHTHRYYGLYDSEREAVEEEIAYLETTLRKWCPDLVSFSNFTDDQPNRIRIQMRYDSTFTGVHYLDLPHNKRQEK